MSQSESESVTYLKVSCLGVHVEERVVCLSVTVAVNRNVARNTWGERNTVCDGRNQGRNRGMKTTYSHSVTPLPI